MSRKQKKHSLLENLQILRHYLLISSEKRKLCHQSSCKGCRIESVFVFWWSEISVTLGAKVFWLQYFICVEIHCGCFGTFERPLCLQIKSVDKKQVQTEDNEQLRIWMRWAKPLLWGISNKTPTQFCGSRTTALLAHLASSSCFITSFGILSRISASSRFWHSTTAWVVGRCSQHLGSTGCLLRLHGLNSTGGLRGSTVRLQGGCSLNCSYSLIFPVPLFHV